MKILQAKFLTSAVQPHQYPEGTVPEIAFAGRSNVGKSSLINALLGTRIAKISKQPGHTRLLNFFDIRIPKGELRFVDLPGYGYAKVSKTERAAWKRMIGTFLQKRKELALLVIIVDIRRDPQALDLDMVAWAREEGIPHIIAATKADKLAKTKLGHARKLVAQGCNLEPQDVYVLSSQNKYGLDGLWTTLEQIIF